MSKKPYFEVHFLGRVYSEPKFGNGQVFFLVETIRKTAPSDGGDPVVRSLMIPVKAFGGAFDRLEEDKLAKGDFLEVRGASMQSVKKFHKGEELKDENGEAVFEQIVVIDDNFGEIDHIYGPRDVDEPEKSDRGDRRSGGRNGGGRSGSRSEGGRSSRSGGDDRGGDRDGDRGGDRGGGDRGGGDRGRSGRSGGDDRESGRRSSGRGRN